MKRPLPLDPSYFSAETAHLTARELGALTRLAMHFWQYDSLPLTSAGLAKVALVGPDAIEAMLPRLMPFFERGALFPILREASIAKSERRAKAGRIGGMKGRGTPSQIQPEAI